VKLFLNLSKDEQRTRFLKRIDVPDRNWKFSEADVRERQRWDDYQKAFSRMLSATSTPWAPWYVVPADRKWFARICAAAVLAHTLIEIDPQYPEVSKERRQQLLAVGRDLEREGPADARAPSPAALECRSETATVLTTASFDSKQMNWAILGEFVLAVAVTQLDMFRRLLGTTQINLREFGWALVPAILLLALWELGKLIARRSAATRRQPEPSGVPFAEIPTQRAVP
jgi:hypothetical protein